MSMSKPLRPAIAFVSGVFVCALVVQSRPFVSAADPPADQGISAGELAALKADVARLKSIATDQSHTMADVSYHFSNLWFAGQAENWPLAQFYSDETHSHLRWAVRVIPRRKDRDGRDVDLDGILTTFEQTSLKDLDDAIKSKDKARFTAAYKAQMENCMACHRASAKEFIRLHLPERPETPIVDYSLPPEASK